MGQYSIRLAQLDLADKKLVEAIFATCGWKSDFIEVSLTQPIDNFLVAHATAA
jgi:hypothetical protein